MPSFVIVQNMDRPIGSPARIQMCSSFVCRLRGLMFRSRLDVNDGLLLQMPNQSRLDASIHMFFVPFALAVFWVNTGMEIVDKVVAQPWRPAYLPARPARFVLEMHPERFSDYEIGQRVEFVRV